jgi:ATP-dependent Clp protease ATP-binding subunit ClpC
MNSKAYDYTQMALNVFKIAENEARRLGHGYIGTEHILLGIISGEENTAQQVLTRLGLPLENIRSAIEFTIGSGTSQVGGELGLTTRAKRVVELAAKEASEYRSHYISTEHLLIGLLLEGGDVCSSILESFALDVNKVRAEVLNPSKKEINYKAELVDWDFIVKKVRVTKDGKFTVKLPEDFQLFSFTYRSDYIDTVFIRRHVKKWNINA